MRVHRQGERLRTCFQEGGPAQGAFDLKTDLAVVYGLDETLAQRCAGWRRRGYRIHVMTGVAWSDDQREYVQGRWDGVPHEDERQMSADGRPRMHGPDVAYMVPTERYGRFRAEKLRLAVDAGAEAIHLEEPEFWVSSGYAPAFRRMWQERYGEPWRDPVASAAAQWQASELKAWAYLHTLAVLCRDLKAYAQQRYGRALRFYVPTHSLVNYSQWGIVSPASRLLEIPGCDGYIAQVWTGTARTPNRYRGVRRERTFETAFLEYGAMADLVRGTDHRLWLLHDPVEDDPGHTWADYRENWQRTVAASLFQTHVADFEVAPWPSRVFLGRYPVAPGAGREPGEREGLPPEYAGELLGVMNALADMDQPVGATTTPVAWGAVGLAVSDSMMNQRGRPGPADLEYDQFYGQALPLLKAGAPLRPVQLDCLGRPGHLDGLRLLVLSYDLQKPPSALAHDALARWVHGGGALLYVGTGDEPFAAVDGWWRQAGARRADEHLWARLGVPDPGGRPVPCGRGWAAHLPLAPEALARTAQGCAALVDAARELAGRAGLVWGPGSAWSVERGPYVVAAVLADEGGGGPPSAAWAGSGWAVSLFAPHLRPEPRPRLAPGQVGLWVRIPAPGSPEPRVVAAQGRVEPPAWDGRTFSFRVGGPEGTTCRARVYLPRAPLRAELRAGADPGQEGGGRRWRELAWDWHPETSTAGVAFANRPEWCDLKFTVDGGA